MRTFFCLWDMEEATFDSSSVPVFWGRVPLPGLFAVEDGSVDGRYFSFELEPALLSPRLSVSLCERHEARPEFAVYQVFVPFLGVQSALWGADG